MSLPTSQLIRDMLITIFVSERAKIAYVPVMKSGSTTLLEALAMVQGHESPGTIDIHDRRFYVVPEITSLPMEKEEEILTSSEWMRLAVYRDPFKRLYSAWEDKILIGRPGYEHREEFRTVETVKGLDVGASYRAFVKDFSEHPEFWMNDPHFVPQVRLTRPDVINYTDVVMTSDLAGLISTISTRSGVPLNLERRNEGLGLPGNEFLDEDTISRIHDLYRDDFAVLSTSSPTAPRKPRKIYLDPLAIRLRSTLRQRYFVTYEVAKNRLSQIEALQANQRSSS